MQWKAPRPTAPEHFTSSGKQKQPGVHQEAWPDVVIARGQLHRGFLDNAHVGFRTPVVDMKKSDVSDTAKALIFNYQVMLKIQKETHLKDDERWKPRRVRSSRSGGALQGLPAD